jgi:tRNA 2-selenouridine synthase
MSHVMRQIGWDVKRLAGGYKAYRLAVVAGIEAVTGKLTYRVICGLTGSGKTILLRHLERHGAQTLDLEQLARIAAPVGRPARRAAAFAEDVRSRLWQKLRAWILGGRCSNPKAERSETSGCRSR